MRSAHETVGADAGSQISRIYTLPGGATAMVLRDGTALELSDNDVELLELAFESECDNCGFDPRANPFEDSEDEDEEYEDDQVYGGEEDDDEP